MSRVKSVTTEYEDGSTSITKPQVPYNAADAESQHLGLVIGDQFIFPDGSWKELGSLGSVNHGPAPLGGQYPRERPKLICAYWETKYRNLCTEFDKLKQQLGRRGASFEVKVGSITVDGVRRLKDLSKEIIKAAKERKQARQALQDVTPQQIQPSMEEIMYSQKREAAFFETVQDINRPEEEEPTKQPQRMSTR